MANCQTSNGFKESSINTAIADRTAIAQEVNLPKPPDNCDDRYSVVKVVLPEGSRLESDARRLKAGLDLANARIRTSNAQIQSCIGKNSWYEELRRGYNTRLNDK